MDKGGNERTQLFRLTAIDGGMNQVFAARVPGGNTGLSEGGEGQSLSLANFSRAPGTIPSTVNPPRAPGSDEPVVAAPASAPAPAPAPPTRVASAAPTAQSDGFFSNLARKIGLGGTADTTAATPPPSPAKPKAEAKRGEQAPRPEAATPKAAASKPAETKQAATRPQPKPSVTDSAPAAEAPAPKDTLVAGSQPIVQTNSFDSRFSAAK